MKWSKLFFLFFIFLFSLAGVSYGAPKVEEPWSEDPGQFAVDLSDQTYFQKLRESIITARKTLDIAVENFSLTDHADDPVAHLIEDLILTQKKGVRVRIFLNTFSENAEDAPLFLREDVLFRMRREGIEVHFVSPSYHLRDRLVIVDGQEVIEGGIPWNKRDFEKGLGSGVLVHSAQVAEKKRLRLEFLPLWDVEQRKIERVEGGIPIPFYLLRDMRAFPAMVNHEDADAFKIYLALLRVFYQVQDVHLTASFEELGREIPAENYYEKGALQFQVVKTLERLATEYGLIEIEEKAADRFLVRMVFPSQNDAEIRVPVAFFQENYAKELSSEALYTYFVILYRTQVSGEAPVWLGSERNVEQDFPVVKEKFRAGVDELRRKNLIEVYPFKLQQGYKLLNSLEYRYLVNSVATMSERLENWNHLRDQYGEESFKRAREMADFLGEPEDPKVIAAYLDLMKYFKTEDVLSFTERLAGLPPESTPQKLAYLRMLLEHETQKAALATP